MQFHVLVGGLLAVQAGVLEHDAETFAGLHSSGLWDRARPVRIFPLVGIQQRGQHLDGGGFAGAVGAEEGKDLARCDVEGNVVDGGKVAEFLDQVLYLDHERPSEGQY